MHRAGQHPSRTETGMPFEPNTVHALHDRARKETGRKSIRFQLSVHVERETDRTALYADDIVLLADNQRDMQLLINISGREATDLGLEFSAEKSGVMVFNDVSTVTMTIQHFVIPRVKEYKYLGVWINEEENYSRTHEEQLKIKGK